MTSDLNKVRKDYGKHSLEEDMLDKDPIKQLDIWLSDARRVLPEEYNSFCLNTIGLDGYPKGRIVLLRSLDDGVVFYTNYESDKGKELAANDRASVLFFWPELERQVRIIARARKVSSEQSDAYFASRPRESQLGAWASDQSKVLLSRADLESKLVDITKEYEGRQVPRPPHWGGYRLIPSQIEFWQGRPSRLHDRLVYSRDNDHWIVKRIQP